MKSGVESQNITLHQFNPEIITGHYYWEGKNYPRGHMLKARYVRDYELELITFSEGSMIIDNVTYPVSAGDIIFRRPGQFTQGIMPYVCYYICFDLLGTSERNPKAYVVDDDMKFQNNYSNDVLDQIPTLSRGCNLDKYRLLFDTILDRFINPDVSSALIIKAYILQIMYNLHMDAKNPLLGGKIPFSAHYRAIRKAVKYIEDNMESPLSLSDLSFATGLSPNYFHRIFSREMGITPNNYINKIKLDNAKRLLAKTEMSIADIAMQCGFENVPYFSFLFKKQHKMTPYEFRELNRFQGLNALKD